MNRISRKPQLY